MGGDLDCSLHEIQSAGVVVKNELQTHSQREYLRAVVDMGR
jgi:hypothetical protein